MRKRPLCIIAVLLLLFLWILPKDVWYEIPDIPSGEKCFITGRVVKREQKEEKSVYYLKNCQTGSSESIFSVLAYTPKGDSYPIGCELSLYGTIYQLEKAGNPGQFDAVDYYQSQGILYTVQVETVIEVRGGGGLREELTALREFFGEKILEIFDERDGGILKAILLGDKSSLREEDELLYQKNGISHVLAISGLHISMIGVSLYKFLRKCRLTFIEAGIPSGLLLFCYGIMTGFGISTIRAVCMFLAMIFSEILGRTYDMASAMALAAIIVLIRNPLQAWQAGFLLSFGAVTGICFVYPVISSVFQMRNRMMKTILFSLSILLITYPISVHFFYEYPLYSTLLNFIVIPCMPIVMGAGGVGMLAGCISNPIGKVLGFPAHVILGFYEKLGELVLRFPGAVTRLGREEFWQLALYYVLLIISLLLVWYGRRRIYLLLIPVAVMIVTVRIYCPVEFTMLDVGQGDCLFLQLEDKTTCLVDGGSVSLKNVGKYRILPFLKYEGIDRIDYVILTHVDEDYVSGIRELIEMQGTLEGIEIKTLLFPAIQNPDEKYQDLWEMAEKKGIQVKTIGAGDRIFGGKFLVQCLYPEKGVFTDEKNDVCTVLQLKYQEFSMLLTGDLGFDGENRMLQKGMLQSVDVWKVSHHGSKYSGGEEFLQVIQPKLSIISVGRNSYGHPSKEILERLGKIESYIKTTLEQGAIRIQSDGKVFWVETMR